MAKKNKSTEAFRMVRLPVSVIKAYKAAKKSSKGKK